MGKKSVEENTVGSGNGEVVQRIAKFEYTPYDPSREGSISGPEGEEVITVGAAKSKEVVISELVATIRPEPKPEPGPVLDPQCWKRSRTILQKINNFRKLY